MVNEQVAYHPSAAITAWTVKVKPMFTMSQSDFIPDRLVTRICLPLNETTVLAHRGKDIPPAGRNDRWLEPRSATSHNSRLLQTLLNLIFSVS